MPDAAFIPTLRFAVCSDLHIKEADDVHVQRLRQLMQTVYAVAQEDPFYKNVDAFLFAGDLTDHGLPPQFRAYWDTVQRELQSGTQVLACIPRYHDNWEKGRNAEKTGLRHFREITGLSTDTHLTLGGYHFIAISTCEKKARYYSRKQKRWLGRALREAAKEAPGKPIFVMQHEHVRGTVYGSSTFDGWGLTCFSKLFARYPQIVHFSGHSHYPLNDPRSVVQKDFTTIGTGALSYAEFTVENERCVHPEKANTMSQGWIVEADDRGRLRLRGFDFLSGEQQCKYTLAPPYDKTHFTLTEEKQNAKSSPPRFADGAALQTEQTGEELRVTVPAAESTDGFPVFLYRAELSDKDGKALASAYTIHEYWFVHDKPFYTVTLPLQSGAARVRVWAENAYGMASGQLTEEV